MAKKLILSCDTGVDDALAIAYAAGQSQMELIGVAASYGMSWVQNTARNSKHVLRLLGKNVPVYMGSEAPLCRPVRNFDEHPSLFHGKDGVADTLGRYKPEDVAGMAPGDAIDFMVESARRYGKDLVIVTTGPLTDLARALEADADALRGVGQIVCMAGALATPGNVNPYAEANAHIDPEAAKLVLEAELPLTLVGLDVTRKTLLTAADLARWQGMGTEAARFFSAIVRQYLAAYAKLHPYLAGCALHDPLAVGIALHPEWITAVPMHLTCVVGGEADGRTCENLDKSGEKGYDSKGAFSVNSAAFESEFFGIVETLLRQ